MYYSRCASCSHQHGRFGTPSSRGSILILQFFGWGMIITSPRRRLSTGLGCLYITVRSTIPIVPVECSVCRVDNVVNRQGPIELEAYFARLDEAGTAATLRRPDRSWYHALKSFPRARAVGTSPSRIISLISHRRRLGTKPGPLPLQILAIGHDALDLRPRSPRLAAGVVHLLPGPRNLV